MGEGPESATPPDILQSHDVDPVYRALEAQRVDGEKCGRRGVVRTVSCTLVIQNSFYFEKLVCMRIQHWRCLLFAHTKYSYLYALTSIAQLALPMCPECTAFSALPVCRVTYLSSS